MIQIDVKTIDQEHERFTSTATREVILAELEKDTATFCLSDEKNTVWFPKQHIIRVKIKEILG